MEPSVSNPGTSISMLKRKCALSNRAARTFPAYDNEIMYTTIILIQCMLNVTCYEKRSLGEDGSMKTKYHDNIFLQNLIVVVSIFVSVYSHK